MPRDSAAADRPASYLVGTAAAFPLFFRDRTKPINQLPFSPSAKFPKSGSSCESRVNEAKRLAPAVLAEFNNIIEQARLRFERAACRDATLAEPAHLDTLSSDQLLRQSPAVLDNLFERLDLNPPQAVANGSKVMPFKTIISEWAKERKVAPQGERSFTARAERFITFIREHHRAADADDMARVSPEEVIDYNNKTDLSHDTISNHIAALRYAFRLCQAQSENPL
jgi:hypothetical protein